MARWNKRNNTRNRESHRTWRPKPGESPVVGHKVPLYAEIEGVKTHIGECVVTGVEGDDVQVLNEIFPQYQYLFDLGIPQGAYSIDSTGVTTSASEQLALTEKENHHG